MLPAKMSICKLHFVVWCQLRYTKNRRSTWATRKTWPLLSFSHGSAFVLCCFPSQITRNPSGPWPIHDSLLEHGSRPQEGPSFRSFSLLSCLSAFADSMKQTESARIVRTSSFCCPCIPSVREFEKSCCHTNKAREIERRCRLAKLCCPCAFIDAKVEAATGAFVRCAYVKQSRGTDLNIRVYFGRNGLHRETQCIKTQLSVCTRTILRRKRS